MSKSAEEPYHSFRICIMIIIVKYTQEQEETLYEIRRIYRASGWHVSG